MRRRLVRSHARLASSLLLLLLLLLSLVVGGPPTLAQGEAVVYVDPARGNDRWSGTLPGPNVSGSDGPFATLERARAQVRGLVQRQAVTVALRGGTYDLPRGFQLTASDSGTAERPVSYRAYQNEAVVLAGGVSVPATAWSRALPASVRERLPPAARERVVALDLASLGATNTGSLPSRSWHWWPTALPMELVVDGAPQTLARFPNLDDDGQPQYVRYGAAHSATEIELGSALGARASRWRLEEAVLACFCDVVWGDYHYRASLASGRLRLDIGSNGRPVKSSGRAYIYNLIEELDAPGEYIIDRAARRLYAWLPAAASRVLLTTAEVPVVTLDGASHLRFEGITIEGGRAGGMTITPSSHTIALRGLTFRATGLNALTLGSRGVSVERSHFVDVETAIEVSAGDRRSLRSSEASISFSRFERTGRWLRTYQPAVRLRGVGARVSNNLFTDLPHAAILLSGNDHRIERNEFRNAVSDSGDMGAIYAHRSWSLQGNLIQHNFIHAMPRDGSTGSARVGIYLDQSLIGFQLHGNIIDNVEQALSVRGYGNTITNNVITRSGEAGAVYLHGGAGSALVKVVPELETWPYRSPPWSTSYPELVAFVDRYRRDPSVANHPTDTRLQHNVLWSNARTFAIWEPYLREASYRERYGVALSPNAVEGSDPGWVRVVGGQAVLQRGRTSFGGIAFEPIPVEQIGLQGAGGPPPAPTSRPIQPPPPPSPTAVPTSAPVTPSPQPPGPTPPLRPTSGPPQPSGNLLRNGDFEGVWRGWQSITLSVGGTNMHPQAARTGGYGALIRGSARIQQDLTGLSPNTTYTLSGYVQSIAGPSRAGLYVRAYGGPELQRLAVEQGQFEHLSLSFTTGSGQTTAEVGFVAPIPDDRIHYADDLVLVAGTP